MLTKANRFLGGQVLWRSAVVRRFMSVSTRAVVDDAAKDGELRVFVVSGEVSGDAIGARLMASLKKLSPFPVKFCGIGGLMMSRHGLQSLFPMEDLAVMGIWELLPHLNKFRARLKETVEAALVFKPHVVVTVDSKGFSFRFLKQLRAAYSLQVLDCPMHFHYVAPSFWAWKGGEARLKALSSFVDHIFCILPFEEEACRINGLAATFVGHPVLEDCLELKLGKDSVDWKVQTNGQDFRKRYDIPPGAKVITLLPGSRIQEVTRMLPIFLKTIELLKGSFPELRIVLLVAPNQHVEHYVSNMVHHSPAPVTLIPGNSTDLKYDAFNAFGLPYLVHLLNWDCAVIKMSTAALCTSGTVAVELQLARLPCLVAYRAHFLTEWFIRYKAKVPYISLPNILLDSPVIPEALFQTCTPKNLASSLMELIQDDDIRGRQIDSTEKVIRLLCPQENDRVQCDWLGTSPPSMIAAWTLLYYRRQ